MKNLQMIVARFFVSCGLLVSTMYGMTDGPKPSMQVVTPKKVTLNELETIILKDFDEIKQSIDGKNIDWFATNNIQSLSAYVVLCKELQKNATYNLAQSMVHNYCIVKSIDALSHYLTKVFTSDRPAQKTLPQVEVNLIQSLCTLLKIRLNACKQLTLGIIHLKKAAMLLFYKNVLVMKNCCLIFLKILIAMMFTIILKTH